MNCIIIDDEPLARQGMEILIKNMTNLVVSGVFGNPLDALSTLQNQKIDLMFLDINMPEMSGLELLKTLKEKPMVIFTTAYPQYAIDSYEFDAIDYLLKPIRLERFVKAVNKAQNYFDLIASETKNATKIEAVNHDFIFIKADRKFFKVFFEKILFIEGLKDYVIIHTKDQKIITAMNLKTIFDILPAKLFFRINKSNIINNSQISSFDSNSVYINDQEIAIGQSYKEDFLRIFKEN
jgi:two-component system, LytTR family, response regulator